MPTVEGEHVARILALDLHDHAIFHGALAGKEAFEVFFQVFRFHFGKEADAPQIHAEHGDIVGDGDVQRGQERPVAAEHAEQVAIGKALRGLPAKGGGKARIQAQRNIVLLEHVDDPPRDGKARRLLRVPHHAHGTDVHADHSPFLFTMVYKIPAGNKGYSDFLINLS